MSNNIINELKKYKSDFSVYCDISCWRYGSGYPIEDAKAQAKQFNVPVCVRILDEELLAIALNDALVENSTEIQQWANNKEGTETFTIHYGGMWGDNIGRVCYPDGHVEFSNLLAITLCRNEFLDEYGYGDLKSERNMNFGFLIIDIQAEIDPRRIGQVLAPEDEQEKIYVLTDEGRKRLHERRERLKNATKNKKQS